MDAVTVILIAIGLAMDAFAVSIANGIVTTKQRKKYALLTAFFFGGFQMLMPVIGWFLGLRLEVLIRDVDHWIAFGLLAFIGGKMIYDSIKKEHSEKVALGLRSLFTLAVATSIDALMVGFGFAFLDVEIAIPVLVIGIVTFMLSFTGFFFGCGLGKLFGNKVRIIGGLVLIAIGLRILLEHLL